MCISDVLRVCAAVVLYPKKGETLVFINYLMNASVKGINYSTLMFNLDMRYD